MLFHRLVSPHFRKPQGILGQWAANFMERNNQNYYAEVMNRLDIGDQDALLEIGFGGGQLIQKIAAHYPHCRIDGLDFSKLMLKQARRRNRGAIRRQQVRLWLGDCRHYDFGGMSYDGIVAVNVIYFWDDLAGVLGRLFRLLSPNGRLLLFMSSAERLNTMPLTATPIFHKHTRDEVEAGLKSAGFQRVLVETVLTKGMETFYIRAFK